jgi:glycosyltransferase involved in cell wall biosynthesis
VLPVWIVAQIGARETYAAARAFVPAGRLDRLYTDVWCRFGARWLRRGPSTLRALAGRAHPDLPGSRVVSFTPGAMRNEILARVRRPHGAAVYDEYLRIGHWFDRRVAAHAASHALPAGPSAFFGYATGCLQTLGLLRRRGVVTLVDQIDPARIEYDIVREEAAKWPGWTGESADDTAAEIPDAYFDRLAAEWDAADAVVVNSTWSARALAAQGVPAAKIHVVPLAFEPAADAAPPPSRDPARAGPIVVLWLGNVILRKGIPYFLEAARLLAQWPIRFVVVGPIGVSAQVVASAPPNVEFRGRATRDRTAAAYDSADLFVLPTLSDGFAITQLEAMAHGLPVIATPNCGEVVSHGQDGLIVPPADAQALAAAIVELAEDPERRVDMGRQALLTARKFSLATYASRLDDVASGRLASDA